MAFERFNITDLSESWSHKKWDSWVRGSNGATLFHRQSFLRYHGDRFSGCERYLGIRKKDEVVGLFPVAVFSEDERTIARSPWGGSCGGPVFRVRLRYREAMEVVHSILEWCRREGIDQLDITLPIRACYTDPCETWELALMENGFTQSNLDISSVVSLDGEVSGNLRSKTRNLARKGEASGAQIRHDAPVDDFWSILSDTYKKHGVAPTHTLEELKWLKDNLGKSISFPVAYLEEVPVAGVGVFNINENACSSFYLAQLREYQKMNVLTFLVVDVLEKASREGFRFFDFGTSSHNGEGRENIFQFKEGFGARGEFRKSFRWCDD